MAPEKEKTDNDIHRKRREITKMQLQHARGDHNAKADYANMTTIYQARHNHKDTP